MASNLAGSAESNCNVTVKGRLPAETSDSEVASDVEPIKPKIQTPLKDTEIFEGSRVRLDCIIIGQPEPEVIWYHDERPVKESADFQLLFQGDKCSLIIEEAYLEDGGEYKAVAINSAGEATSQCKVTVTPIEITDHPTRTPQPPRLLPDGNPPVFVKLLNDVIVSEGDSVSFECVITGDPKPDIKWLLNNQEVTQNEKLLFSSDLEKDTYLLHIPKVSTNERGVYTVKASNPCGDAKCFAQLIVKTIPEKVVPTETAPQIIKPLADKTLNEGETVVFECVVQGKPYPKIQWLKNNMPIDFGYQTSSGDTQILTIQSTPICNEGTIKCIAENNLGKATTEAKLTIKSREVVPVGLSGVSSTQKTSSSVMFQSSTKSTTFSSTSSGISEPQTQFHSVSVQSQQSSKSENDKPIEHMQMKQTEEIHQVNQSQPIVQKESFVNIEKASETSAIEAPPPPVFKKSPRKTIPPKFVSPVMGKIVTQGADVTLEGIIEGFPTPDVSWSKNGQTLESSENGHLTIEYSLNKTSVALKNVDTDDSGKYTCEAVNEAGSAKSTADVVVKSKYLSSI